MKPRPPFGKRVWNGVVEFFGSLLGVPAVIDRPVPSVRQPQREPLIDFLRGFEGIGLEPPLEKRCRAASAYYDLFTDEVVVKLLSGATLLVPCELIQGVAEMSAEEVGHVAVVERGRTLRWKALGVSHDVLGLLYGTFGTSAWMRSINREEE